MTQLYLVYNFHNNWLRIGVIVQFAAVSIASAGIKYLEWAEPAERTNAVSDDLIRECEEYNFVWQIENVSQTKDPQRMMCKISSAWIGATERIPQL